LPNFINNLLYLFPFPIHPFSAIILASSIRALVLPYIFPFFFAIFLASSESLGVALDVKNSIDPFLLFLHVSGCRGKSEALSLPSFKESGSTVILLFSLSIALFLIRKLGKQLSFGNISDLTTFYCKSDGTAAKTGYEKSISFILPQPSPFRNTSSLLFSFAID
jgi:hypothetical protein